MNRQDVISSAPPPLDPPERMLTSIVLPLTAKVLPTPIKFNVVALPILAPAEEIPIALIISSTI